MPAGKMKRSKYSKSQQQVRAIARQEAKKVINSELETKAFDEGDTDIPVADFSAPVLPLALVPQGDAADERNDDWITPVYLRVRGNFVYGDEYNNVRLVIFQYKDDGNAPTSGTIFKYDSLPTAVWGPFRELYKNSYNVIYDKVFYVDNQSSKSAKFDIKIKGKKLRKIQISGSETPVYRSGGLFLAVISDSDASSHPKMNFISTLYFHDA